MSAIGIITYKDLRVVYTNLEGLTIEEAMKGINAAIDVIHQYPHKSVYSLVNMTDMRFNSELRDEISRVGKINAPYMKATVIVGLTSITKLMAKAIIKLTGRKAALFDDVESGKEWLYQVSIDNK